MTVGWVTMYDRSGRHRNRLELHRFLVLSFRSSMVFAMHKSLLLFVPLPMILAMSAVLFSGRTVHSQESKRSNRISGELRFAENSNKDSEKPEYVVVGDGNMWHLVIVDAKLAASLKRSVGYTATVGGRTSTTKLDDGTTRVEVLLESMTMTPRASAKTAEALAKRKAAARERFQVSQKPLTKKEKSEVLAEFGMDSSILDLELNLKYVLQISQYRSGHRQWVIQPDGAFENFRYLPAFGGPAGAAGLTKLSQGKGKLSQRQIVALARLMNESQLLDLPEQIGDDVKIDELTGRSDQDVIEVSFGEFKCRGNRARATSKEFDEVKKQQRRLTLFAYRFTAQVTENLKFQKATKK